MLSLNLPSSVVGKSVKVLDVRGYVLMQKTVQGVSETMDVSTLNRGLYLVQIQGFAAKKFVVK